MINDKQEHHGDEHQHSTATLYKDSSIRSPREEDEMEDNLLLLLHPKHSCSYLDNKKIQEIVKKEKEDKSPAIIGLPLLEENYQPRQRRQSVPTINPSRMVGGDSKTPYIVIPPCCPQEEELPTAQFLTSWFLTDPTFSCPADGENTPHGDIKSSEKNDEWQPAPSSYAGHGSTRKKAAIADHSREANITGFSLSREEPFRSSLVPCNHGAGRRRDHVLLTPDAMSSSIDRTCSTRSPAFPKYRGDKPRPSNATNPGALFDLPKKLNLPSIHNATQFLSCANHTSSSVGGPIDYTIGKTSQYYSHQKVLSNIGDTDFSNDSALLDDIKCNIVSNTSRKLVTGFTYAVMCQFTKATFSEGDRRGNRSKIPIGHGGLKCKHCEGKGLRTGRYFPSSFKSFADPTKTLLPMHRHLILCHKCPDDMKSLIDRWHDRHGMELKLKNKRPHRGKTMLFYRQIWLSLHPDAMKKTGDVTPLQRLRSE